MVAFESVSADEFARAVADGAASAVFREEYARYEPSLYDGREGPDFQVHYGDLMLDGNFIAPGLATLIVGNLTVSGHVDLRNDDAKGFDEGGLFIVLGSVRCRSFIGHFGKCSFVDGDLTAAELLLTGYADSSLVVTGHLRTRFYYARDTWAHVGGGATIEYGAGGVLPLISAKGPTIMPQHGKEASLAILALGDFEDDDDPDFIWDMVPGELVELVRSDQPVFR